MLLPYPSAQAADAAVTVGLIEPTNAIIEGSTIPVHATASSPEDIYYVEAELEGLSIELTPTEGDISGGVRPRRARGRAPYGPHVVTVHAYNTFGEVASTQGTVHRYAPPTIGWNVQPHDTLTDGFRFAAKCIPTPPYQCKSLWVRFQTDNGSYELLAEPGFPFPQPVPGRLYVKEGTYDGHMIPSGRAYTLIIEVNDYIGPTITKTIGPIYVERSPRLTAVQRAPAPSSISTRRGSSSGTRTSASGSSIAPRSR